MAHQTSEVYSEQNAVKARQSTHGIVYIICPFSDKERAKSRGARWDAVCKKWYIENGKRLELFAEWLHDADRQALHNAQQHELRLGALLRNWSDCTITEKVDTNRPSCPTCDLAEKNVRQLKAQVRQALFGPLFDV